MTKPGITVEFKPTLAELLKRTKAARKALIATAKYLLDKEGARFIEIEREEAPKRKGTFAAALRHKTFTAGETTGFRAYSSRPLGRWILEGTPAHLIQARNVRSLAFLWPRGPRAPGYHFYVHVHHPGTKANKFVGRAYRRWLPGARGTLRSIGGSWVRVLKGESKEINL